MKVVFEANQKWRIYRNALWRGDRFLEKKEGHGTPNLIDEYKSTFSCIFLATKSDEITAVLSEGVIVFWKRKRPCFSNLRYKKMATKMNDLR